MNEGFRVSIRQDIYDLNYCLHVWRKVGDSIEYVTLDENQHFILTLAKPYEPVKPFLNLPFIMAKELFTGLAEALDQSGIKTESDAKIAGLLEATKMHLEDMRTLVFKPRKGAHNDPQNSYPSS